MRPGRITICTTPGCPEYVEGGGRCPEHQRAAEQRRGTARQRGYGGRTWTRARAAVLRRDPICTVCRAAPSTVADHWPTSRRDLLAAGIANPDAPERMRGLCVPCHSRETAREQPGGWRRDAD